MFTPPVEFTGQRNTTPHLGPERQRQTLRGLLRHYSSADRHLDEVLRSALEHTDAEVRLTAVLVAARLRARRVLPELQAALPAQLRALEEPRERRFHEQLWRGVIRYLQEHQLPYMLVPGRDPLRLLRGLLAGTLEVADAESLLLHSLTTPLELGSRPSRLPSGVVERNGQYRLRRSGVPLRWIAPVAHWVGAAPLRRVRSAGFFVAQVPLERSLATWVGNPLPIRVIPDREQVWLGSFEQAQKLCETLSRVENVFLRMPTADEWEMAARGPDGRRYPWGNLPHQEGWEQCASPWGVEGLVGDVPEWTHEPERDTPLLRGGVESRTWVRHVVEPCGEEFVAALRLVIPAG